MLSIGIDMDGTIANWEKAAVEEVNKNWPQLNIKNIITVNSVELIQDLLLKENIKITREEIALKLCPKGLFRNLEPYEDIYETIKYLSEFAKIYIVTRPIEWSYTPQEKTDWLKEHLRDIKYEVILTESSESKGLLNLDIMIDDNPRVFYESVNRRTLFFVPRQPWNIDFQIKEEDNNRICFINKFKEIYFCFKQIK